MELNVVSQIAIFFSKMAMVNFGGANAVLAYVAQHAVEQYQWLKAGEMLDGVGMAQAGGKVEGLTRGGRFGKRTFYFLKHTVFVEAGPWGAS